MNENIIVYVSVLVVAIFWQIASKKIHWKYCIDLNKHDQVLFQMKPCLSSHSREQRPVTEGDQKAHLKRETKYEK